ncbi:SAM-dependent methyltransferase [Limnobacter parvus]|uniref:SAM-dependent methyltransferase n=1 Tax=Limnobacter parvus TaxID=2939690 RepID=A0ABT1XHY7_9BURK|nr:SAM-dependent methyltransferase [Limnobacter parvus]MCR2746901.1 SAM-dependent methyltransferase [Limnobacter parvus]
MLYLVPSPLSQKTPKLPVLAADLPKVQQCKVWLVENAKPARAALSHFNMPVAIRDLGIFEIAQLDAEQRKKFIEQSKAGEPIAIMSDAGCPGVADPGAEIVALAHKLACPVYPLVGPSSILLALMGSGLNGQNFRFYGYPPLEPAQRDTWIKQTEKESKAQKCTQIVIETPFRNEKLIEALLKQLSSDTLLCVAWDLTGDEQHIHTQTVEQWKKQPPSPGKAPCLFLWLAS